MRNLFAGYLNLNTLMFVFDQYVISADVAGYHEELIPIITAIILMILRDQLMSTKSVTKKKFINFFKTNFAFKDWRTR